VFFYGYGDKFRREWMEAMVGEPSRREPEVDFALGGGDFRGDTGAARMLGTIPYNVFPQAISSARVNLNITRRSHASVYASSSCRPFELAGCGAAIVSNPYEGIERRDASCWSCRARMRLWRPTETSWTIPPRPRSWAGAPASARSTSTPTPGGPSSCSS
jgi:hypothetical protein